MNRRTFLKHLTRSAVAVPCLGLTPALLPHAHAADVTGYKALVCVFLLGGIDSHDVLIPQDPTGYDQWSRVRQSLLQTQGSSRARTSLLPIASGASAGGSAYALAPELAGLRTLYEQGAAGIVANVGPLVQPTSKADYLTEGVPLPPRLFSHNDQQSVWQASAPEGARFGWGGQFADAVIAAGANGAPEFSTITSLGNELFLTGATAKPYQVGENGAALFDLLAEEDSPAALSDLLRRHFRAVDADRENLIARDLADGANAGLLANERYNAATVASTTLTTPFPPTELGAQLRAVAQTIAARDQLEVTRQIFFVGMGGFDTHSAQAVALPALLTQLDQALSAFHASLQELSLNDQVTTFTASDFGRTLAVNGDGTDHGWGAHHFVLGGAVNGGVIYGDVPPPVLDHEFDAGGGRLIPTLSIEQYAGPLGRWFGLDDTELATALPNLANFADTPPLMRS